MTAHKKASKSDGVVSADFPRATHSGQMDIAEVKVSCHVLEDATRLVTSRGVIAMISNGPKRSDLGRYIDRIPNKPAGFSMDPVAFRTKTGVVAYGYTVTQVTLLLQLYTSAFLAGQLRADQRHIGERCATIACALLAENLAKRVDAATGYLEDRVKQEFDLKCKLYLVEERKTYEPIISDEVRKELFRLYRLPYHPWKNPPFFQSLYRKYIHDAIDPEMARVIKQRNPSPKHGSAHTQWWSHEGMLRAQEQKFITLLRASSTPADFRMRFRNDQKRTGLQLSFGETG
jgi:hypothetical protein